MRLGIEALHNAIHREVLRVIDRRTRRMPCLISGYDPVNFAVKVQLLPSGQLTGWLPIDQLQTGNRFGIQAAPQVGDPGWVEFHEGDRRAGVFVSATSNDHFPPVPIQAGEVLVLTKWNSTLYFKEDGSISAADGAGASLVWDGHGKLTATDKTGTTVVLDGSGNIVITASGQVQIKGASGTLKAVKLADGSNSNVLFATS